MKKQVIERRPDCEYFEPKEYSHQCGDCQTDGHYLCVGCRCIASFEDMELYDNRMRYYPERQTSIDEQANTLYDENGIDINILNE